MIRNIQYRGRKIMVLLLALGCLTAGAQQKPHYTQYVLNNYILNPALSGIENYTDIKISHRHQWVGLQDAPVTSYFTLHTPIGKKDYKTTATSYAIQGENPRGKQYWQDYQASEPHHGAGLQIINDRAGPFNNFSAYGTYAYHIGLNERTNISAGFGAGVSQVTLNTNKLFFGTDFPVDPAVAGSGELGRMRFDMNAGVWLYSADYFAGVSVNQVVPQRLEFADNIVRLTNGKKVPHIFATAGYRFLLSEDVNMIPSVMVKYVNAAPVQADVNVKLQYRDFLWGGASYRSRYGFAAMAGLNVMNGFALSYSYDYSTTLLNTVSRGTHEIILGFVIGNRYNSDTCPKNIW
ncbi:MAG TPA: type IX secretion system membrane protein PorP/SprF [Lacibacter sp.]|nr:type IX secretion system membrane protein PorP/SprF [Lacibacter sp.]HMO90350.1 type IX secretion system membrane protein PorP/SprF [Lacibacter sp.]